MNKILFFVMVFGLVTGCGRKLTSVTSTTHTETLKDSTVVSRQSTVDSSRYVETANEKTLPKVTVQQTFTRAQFDSLINALYAMPNNGTKERIIQDPTLRAQLAIVLDSLGNIQLRCTSLEKQYFEKSVSDFRYRESLTTELTNVNKLNHEQSVQIKEYQKRQGIKNMTIIFLVVFIVLYFAYKIFF